MLKYQVNTELLSVRLKEILQDLESALTTSCSNLVGTAEPGPELPDPEVVGLGVLTLWRMLSITPLIETNFFIFDILTAFWGFKSLQEIRSGQLVKLGDGSD